MSATMVSVRRVFWDPETNSEYHQDVDPASKPGPNARLDEYIQYLENRVNFLEERLSKLEKDFYVESIVLGNERDREEAVR